MTQRERSLVIRALLVVASVGGVWFLVYSWFQAPLRNYDRQLALLEKDVDTKETDFKKVLLDKKELVEKWQPLSLPASPDRAANEYGQYLRDLLIRKSGLLIDDFVGPPPPAEQKPATAGGPPKKHAHTVLAFKVRGKGTLSQLVHALDLFQRTPLMHRVKSMTVTRFDYSGKDLKEPNPKLTYLMDVEAMILHNAPKQSEYLAGSDTKQRPAESVAREYALLDRKNVFAGEVTPAVIAKKDPPPVDEGPDMREFVQLVSTTPTSNEAHLRNRLEGFPEIRIRPEKGFQFFRIMDEKATREILKAKVLKVEQRDVYFMVGEEVYAMHIGETVAQAMRRPLNDKRLEDAGLLKTFYKELQTLEETKKEEKKKIGKRR